MRLAMVLVLAACGGSPPPPAPPHAHEHGPLGHRFEKAEDWVPVFDDPARDAWQKPAEVIALLAIAPGMTVVDLGAGTGYFEPHLARAVGPEGRVVALDVEADMVRYLRERFRREAIANAVAEQVPFDDPRLPAASADRVLVVDTWHHIPDRAAYVKKLAAGLKPGGRVVVVDFTMESEQGPPKHARIPPETVAEELRAGGLEPSIVAETLPEQYVVVGATRPSPAPRRSRPRGRPRSRRRGRSRRA